MTVLGLWDFLTGPAFLAVAIATAVLAWPAGRSLARRLDCSRIAAVLYAATLGIIAALTLTPNRAGALDPTLPPHFLTQIGRPDVVWDRLTAAPADAEQIANILLYFPVGFVGFAVWRSAARAAWAGAALTVFIETCQYGIIGRAGSLTDIRNNAAGAVLGAGLAAGTALVLRRARSRRTEPGGGTIGKADGDTARRADDRAAVR
ncbi:VanZ family protein [Mangrovihabitans endophyticus]|uniref:VanZ-like domain-containing protein n=1 Tax=Mangrovihabitans endophyticus TaxID=1751298 RepID=A0A8J3FRC2_9ACTN|nr:VanZ family protein [Mangrovihabitans endophyticus]GGL08319.1 hypothetical protein GCM10012284_48530 [Mangrovihabitans endophyticus]